MHIQKENSGIQNRRKRQKKKKISKYGVRKFWEIFLTTQIFKIAFSGFSFKDLKI